MSGDQPIVSFIVPALNEEPNLLPLFDRLLAIEKIIQLPAEILVVDDASDDGTLQVASEAASRYPQIRPLRKPLPHGIGRAIREGVMRARGTVAVIVMADGVDPLERAVPQFCDKILKEQCDLVLLTRYAESGDASTIPRSYRACHFLFRLVTNCFLSVPHPDTTYAFRAFDLRFIRSLDLSSNGFEISPEITFKAYFHGGKLGEVPGRQTRRVQGTSKFLFSKVALGYGRILVMGLALRIGALLKHHKPRPTRTLRAEYEGERA